MTVASINYVQEVLIRGGGAYANLYRMAERDATMAETRDEVLGWAAKAREALNDLPDHPIRDRLSDLADYVVARIT